VARTLTEHRSYIDGAFVAGSARFAVENPATGEAFAEVDDAPVEVAQRAVRAARTAFDAGPWPTMGADQRRAVLGELVDYLRSRRAELVETVIAEAGSVRSLAEWAQVGMALDQAAELTALSGTLPDWEHNELPLDEYLKPTDRVRLSIRRYEPVGVVSAITPYNFPFVTNVVKVFSALVAGCTVILRPSPLTPLEATVFAEAADAVGLPPGVLNVVVESGSAGAVVLTSDPMVDLVSFTGSTSVGRAIAAQAAPTVKRLVLELGGKSVQLYLPDALADGPAPAAVGAATVFASHAGQSCSAQTRMLVPAASRDAVLAAVAEAAGALVVGDPADEKTIVGPVINEAARDRAERYVAESTSAGGTVVCGGARPLFDAGWYVAPTVLLARDNADPAVRDEIFAPVITVQTYESVAEAVQLANDTIYGLSGAVYTTDLAAGMGVAAQIRSGTVHVNVGCATSWTPAGGYKQSGIGRERGTAGLREYQQVKHVAVGRLP
jgi:aldehyde dehydrogenase (NAD+)